MWGGNKKLGLADYMSEYSVVGCGAKAKVASYTYAIPENVDAVMVFAVYTYNTAKVLTNLSDVVIWLDKDHKSGTCTQMFDGGNAISVTTTATIENGLLKIVTSNTNGGVSFVLLAKK